MTKGDIAQLVITSGRAHSCLVDIFCHICQRAACVTKLVLWCIWDPILGEEEVVGGRR